MASATPSLRYVDGAGRQKREPLARTADFVPLVLTEADFAVVRQALADKTAAQVTQVAADECD